MNKNKIPVVGIVLTKSLSSRIKASSPLDMCLGLITEFSTPLDNH